MADEKVVDKKPVKRAAGGSAAGASSSKSKHADTGAKQDADAAGASGGRYGLRKRKAEVVEAPSKGKGATSKRARK